jgi:hypothetical protein
MIWAGHCHVEMYGSCATQLDLPSSDLDVVIRGLDGSENMYLQQNINNEAYFRQRSTSMHISQSDASKPYQKERAFSVDETSTQFKMNGKKALSAPTSPVVGRKYATYPPPNPPPQPYHPPLSANGQRVLRLAAELERQPWAVQVKAIPTASVPVIKILSDPSRLPGTASEIEWMLHQQQMAAAAVAAADMKMSGGMVPSAPNNYHNAQMHWRGSDVMNGLLSLDITFDGPEHGGVGSTAFSAQVVQDVVSETGFPPDSTPAVQVIMVIKEILAQRRLNEPFSGGLSSYGVLLLVVAVIKEREMIRDEIERVERQRHAVASECTTEKAERPNKPLEKKSSWAAIAKKSSNTNTPNVDETKSHGNTKEANKDTASEKPVPVTEKENSKSGKEDQSTTFPQGYNDVLEVLCSGEPTAGKLLMHFLLYYGRHFDSKTTCIDVSGTHHPDYSKITNGTKRHWSPFMTRKEGGNFNGEIYSFPTLVVYDPLEGCESNNVTRSCYAWSNIAWTFNQCFNTLSGVVELGAESNDGRRDGGGNVDINKPSQACCGGTQKPSSSPSSNRKYNVAGNNELHNSRNDDNDVSSPLLELLLCF